MGQTLIQFAVQMIKFFFTLPYRNQCDQEVEKKAERRGLQATGDGGFWSESAGGYRL